MRCVLPFIALPWILTILLCTSNLFANESTVVQNRNYEGKPIKSIVVEGNANFSEKRVKSYLNFLEEGSPMYEDFVRKDFRSLYKTGLFRDIKFLLDSDEEGLLTLTIRVEELPKIANISFSGNKKISTKELLTDLPLNEGDYYSKSLINQSIQHLKDLYREEGYLSTKVSARESTNTEKQTVAIDFEVREGSEVLVGEIVVEGNEALTDKAITRVMKTKTDQWYRQGKFDEIVFEGDRDLILNLYKKNGYINAEVRDIDLEYRWKNPKNKKTKLIHITIGVEEGDQYIFGRVNIRGNRLFPTDELVKGFKRVEGEVFNQLIHDIDIQSITGRYHRRGYIFVRLTPIESVDEGSKRVDYLFDIYEGDIAHIERIFISGNDKTKEHVVRRELAIREGELFNADRIRRSMERLMNLQFFRNVSPKTRPGSVEGLMNINFQLEEQLTALVSAGMQLGSVNGFALTSEVRENNFLGNGQTIGVKVELGQRQKVLSLSFIEPWFMGNPVSLGITTDLSRQFLYYQMDLPSTNADGTTNQTSVVRLPNGEQVAGQEIDYTRDSIGLAIHSTQRFLEWYRNTIRFRVDLERNYLLEVSDWLSWSDFTQREVYEENQDRFSVPPPDQKSYNFVYTISETIARDTRDNWLNTTRGSHASLGLEYILGDYSLTKWHMGYSKYHAFFRFMVGAYSVQLYTLGNNILGNFNYTRRLYYRFYREELRGWEAYNISSFRTLLAQQGDLASASIVGKAKIKHSLEMRFSIAPRLLWGVLYIDAGNLSEDFLGLRESQLDFMYNYWEFMYDFGFGFRIQVPQLPIRFFWSWRSVFNRDDNRFEFFQHNDRLFSTAIPSPTFVLTIGGFF